MSSTGPVPSLRMSGGLVRTNSQPQLSPRSGGAASPLARGASVSHKSPPVTAAENATFLVRTLIEKHELDKLYLHTRQRRITVPMLNEALTALSKEVVVRALGAPLAQFGSTVAHELARSGTFDHVLWMCNKAAELFAVREPASQKTPLHECALMRSDTDSTHFVARIWSTIDMRLLTLPDAAGFTVPHYLAMSNRLAATRVVTRRLGNGANKPPSAANGDTVEALVIVNLERELQRTALAQDELQSKHQSALSELDRALAERDKRLADRERELSLTRAKLNEMTDKCEELEEVQRSIRARGDANQDDLKRAQGEIEAAKQKARDAQAKLDEVELARKMSDRLCKQSVSEAKKLSKLLEEAEKELRNTEKSGGSRTAEMQRECATLRAQCADAQKVLNEQHATRKMLEDQAMDARVLAESLQSELRATHENYAAVQAEARKLREETRQLHAALAQRSSELAALQAERDAALLRRQQEDERANTPPPPAQSDDTEDYDTATFHDTNTSSDNEKVTRAMTELRQQLQEREDELMLLQLKLQENEERVMVVLPPPPPLPPREDENSKEEKALRRNARLNAEFFANLCHAVRAGDATLVQKYFDLKVNPNTRNAHGESLLQTAVVAAKEVHCSVTTMKKEHRVTVDGLEKNLERTIRTIISSGGDWDGLDEYLEACREEAFAPRIWQLLKTRDDIAPFCKALLAGNEAAASAAIGTVEDFMRVPSKYAAEKLTYLHVACAEGYAMLVQQMVQHGDVDANRRDANDRAPLHITLQKCTNPAKRRMIVEYLLAGGAQPTQTCSYVKLTTKTKKLSSARSSSSGTLGSQTTAQAVLEHISAEAQRYGTALAQAEALGATDVLECMRNRRYLRVNVDPQLQEYVVMCVTLHVQVRRLLDAKLLTPDSALHRLFGRYGSVFHCFNPHFRTASGEPYDAVLDAIYRDAGVPDRYALASESAHENELLVRLITNDQAAIASTMANCGAGASTPNEQTPEQRTHANLLHNVCKILMQCTDAVRGRWFEVSPLIEQPARELHPVAVRAALKQLVCENRVDEIDFMLNRNDRLFGELDVNCIVEEKLGYTPIELATHCGVVNALEYFLERQRQRIDASDAKKGTLIQIARRAQQSISIVAIDHFKYRARLCAEKYPNAPHYDMLTLQGESTVLCQCVQQHRPDLLRYCFRKVAFQLEKANRNGDTPLRLAENALKLRFQTAEALEKLERCAEVLRRRLQGATDSPDTSSIDTPRLSRGNSVRTLDMAAVQRAALESATTAVLSDRGSDSSRRRHRHHHHKDGEQSGSGTPRRHKHKHKQKEEES